LFVNSFEFTRLQYGCPYHFVGGARPAELSLKRGIGEHWRGVAGSAKVLWVQQISGLIHATVAVMFAPWRGAAVSATVAPAALDRAQRPLCPAIRAMAATSRIYSASLFAMNAVMPTEFMAMRHGGCDALICSSMRSQRGDHGGKVIETPSESAGGRLKLMTSATETPPKVWYLLDTRPLETLSPGQVPQTILWDEPIASHHVSRNFSWGLLLGEPVEICS
jgi:hypothetical protein